jgi:hypothetical protein
MRFRVTGRPAEHFAHLFDLTDDALAARGAVRRIADAGVMMGGNFVAGIDKLFADPRAAYLHVHFAAAGCYGSLIRRG